MAQRAQGLARARKMSFVEENIHVCQCRIWGNTQAQRILSPTLNWAAETSMVVSCDELQKIMCLAVSQLSLLKQERKKAYTISKEHYCHRRKQLTRTYGAKGGVKKSTA